MTTRKQIISKYTEREPTREEVKRKGIQRGFELFELEKEGKERGNGSTTSAYIICTSQTTGCVGRSSSSSSSSAGGRRWRTRNNKRHAALPPVILANNKFFYKT